MACENPSCSCSGSCTEKFHDTCGCTIDGVQVVSPDQLYEFQGGSACNLDRKNNVWVEGPVDSNGVGGICLLDTLCEQQIVDVLQRDDRARADLVRVTTHPRLLELAATVPHLPKTNDGDTLQKEMNAGTIPFYTQFRGQPPFSQ